LIRVIPTRYEYEPFGVSANSTSRIDRKLLAREEGLESDDVLEEEEQEEEEKDALMFDRGAKANGVKREVIVLKRKKNFANLKL
jgi:hypothetical protein